MAIVDVFHYNGERDVLRIHLSATPWVDKYIICEAKTTFTRKPKELYFFRDQRYFKPWWPKMDYYVINDNYSDEEVKLAQQSPNTQGADHWTWEFLQKERILKGLKACGVQDDDIVYVGDVDEVPMPFHRESEGMYPSKLKLKVYAYYLNNRSDEQFWGTYVAPYRLFKDKILNHERLRTDIRTDKEYGWHFTSMGGYDEVKRKLESSYTAESYYTPEVQASLRQRVESGSDYIGRHFNFVTDEESWPDYIKENRAKYKHLLKSSPDSTPII
jgi:beta-1,4-mannosyl-glycoprotein beta-1,4-N-acetylglucosaminyltransferase